MKDLDLVSLKKRKLELLEREEKKRELLPHLHGHKFYRWQREFWNSRERLLFLNAANQIGKSSIHGKKFVHYATEPSLWNELWPTRPITFWYLYPSLKVADKELRLKWKTEFLPRGEMKSDEQYGWKFLKGPNGLYEGIEFNSGVTLLMKAYEQSVDQLQTGTVWMLGIDEELPIDLWPELQLRVAATKGYISGVFTPTLSQQYWYDVMEEKDPKKIKLPDAHKMTVSLYDCLQYEDGTLSHWTLEEIKRLERTLPNQDEIDRRIHGRFIINKSVLKYASFDQERNTVEPYEVPRDWIYYCGIDSGSGVSGKKSSKSHPAAIVWVAVKPDYTKAVVTDVWVGTPENIQGDDKNTTSADILRQYVLMRAGKNHVATFYDYADRDLGIVAEREYIPINRAEKRHEIGEGLLNTLFKNAMLSVMRNHGGLMLVDELVHLRKDTQKQKAIDNASDALRYALSNVAFDFSNITGGQEMTDIPSLPTQAEIDADRRLAYKNREETYSLEDEMEELNELYSGY